MLVQAWHCVVAFPCRPVGVTLSHEGYQITRCICCKSVMSHLVVVQLLPLVSLVMLLPLALQLLPLVYLMQLLLLASLVLLLLPASVVQLLFCCNGVCGTARLALSRTPWGIQDI